MIGVLISLSEIGVINIKLNPIQSIKLFYYLIQLFFFIYINSYTKPENGKAANLE
jgi:hypothetical protein